MTKKISVAFLGPEATFSDEAARKIFSEVSNAEFSPYPTILDALEAVEQGQVDYTVAPVENSVEGSILITLDFLSRDHDVEIVSEFVLPVQQNLIGVKGATIEGIKQVSSHPQPLAQCRKYLRQLKDIEVIATDSTSLAVQQVVEGGNPARAAIGTGLAASKYGGVILQEGIQDYPDNSTRFFVVSRSRNPDKRAPFLKDQDPQASKSSLVIQLASDHTGALVYILNVFSAVGINLTKIESRPTRRSLGSYWFFIDVEAHQEEERMKRAILAIQTLGHEVRMLGSYYDSLKISKRLIDSSIPYSL